MRLEIANWDSFVVMLPVIIPAALTCLTCPYLFFKYFFHREKSLGFSMVFLLTLSDWIFSLAALMSAIIPDLRLSEVYRIGLYTGMFFSIFWAAAIAYLIYKSLITRDFDPKKSFIRTFALVLVLSISLTSL